MIFADGRAVLDAQLDKIVEGTEVVNLAQEPSFEKLYIERIFF